mmetsp:Transcript_32331/g.97199  ORF Transcript_32331/g.97199 Transcript_32331/m.97199 type:complete len:118 (+) Transcript_32331:2-355(+)
MRFFFLRRRATGRGEAGASRVATRYFDGRFRKLLVFRQQRQGEPQPSESDMVSLDVMADEDVANHIASSSRPEQDRSQGRDGHDVRDFPRAASDLRFLLTVTVGHCAWPSQCSSQGS